MHILCNALRVILGVLVVALVGEILLYPQLHWLINITDVQVSCITYTDQYIPPLWVMCLESVAHLLVMFNFSSNFLIYCSVSNQFKAALYQACQFLCKNPSNQQHIEPTEYQTLPTSLAPQAKKTSLELVNTVKNQQVDTDSEIDEKGKQKEQKDIGKDFTIHADIAERKNC